MSIDIRKPGTNHVIRLADRHACYARDMQLYFDSFFGVVEPVVEGDWRVADFSRCRVHNLHDGREFEFTSIPEEACDYGRFWKGGGLVFDLGAYCGLSAISLASKADRVVALEPDHENFACLKRNIKRAGMGGKIFATSLAVGGECGREQYSHDSALGSGFARLLGRPTAGVVEAVRVVTLDWLVAHFGVPSLIKLDVEGAELEVLATAGPLLRLHHPAIAIDTFHFGGTWQKCEGMLREYGYRTLTEAPGGLEITWGWKDAA